MCVEDDLPFFLTTCISAVKISFKDLRNISVKASPKGTTVNNGNEPMRVLIIEDDVARALNKDWRKNTTTWWSAAAGEEGFFRASAETFDLLVLDLMLPGRNGIEVLTTLRRRGIPTPVLLVTAKDAVEDRVLGLDSGADDYLLKPFAFSFLKYLSEKLQAAPETPPVRITTDGDE
jgi:CheY-like chemotaxis protein